MAWDEEFDPTIQTRPQRPEFYTHKNFEETSLGNAVSEVINGLQENLIPKHLLEELQAAIPFPMDDPTDEYGVRFNMLREINQQMNIIKGLRSEVFTPAGRLKPGMEFKDAKYVLQANDGMLKTMMQQHEKLVNMERFQKIETAVHQALDRLPQEQREVFLQELARILED